MHVPTSRKSYYIQPLWITHPASKGKPAYPNCQNYSTLPAGGQSIRIPATLPDVSSVPSISYVVSSALPCVSHLVPSVPLDDDDNDDIVTFDWTYCLPPPEDSYKLTIGSQI
jgi:hypothetical protein